MIEVVIKPSKELNQMAASLESHVKAIDRLLNDLLGGGAIADVEILPKVSTTQIR